MSQRESPQSKRTGRADKDPPQKWGPLTWLRGSLWWILGGITLLWLWQETIEGIAVETIPYSAFKQRLQRGEVSEVVIETDVVAGHVVPRPGLAPVESNAAAKAQSKSQDEDASDTSAKTEPFYFRAVRIEDPKLVEQLEAANVEFVGKRPRLLGQFLWAWLLPIGLMLLIWSFLARRMSAAAGQALGFGKSRARLIADKSTGVTFDDVAGADEAKLELREVVDFLRNPGRYEALGAKIPKGVLLVGPPGTGKTLLARAVAGEAGTPFFSISGSDFVEMFAGVGAARVRDLFERAVEQAPCIIFIDEIDAVGRQRGVHTGVVNDEREQTLNQLLVELDGFETNKGVIILAATNRPDVLDRALLRPGRFDRQIILDAPDFEGRKAVLQVHIRNKPVDETVDLDSVARGTPGFSGADLANAVNEAALLAARRGASKMGQQDIEEAVEKVVAGPERRSRRLDGELKRRVAFHEVGHALVAYHSEHADPVHKISIVPRGHAALGYTLQLPEADQLLLTQSELFQRIRGTLGGRAAEELVFGEVSTGAENDLEKATAIARQMISMLGMNDRVGLAHVAQKEGSVFLPMPGFAMQRDCSEQTAREVDEEVRELLARAYRDAKSILVEHRDQLERVAAALLEHETLDRKQFFALVETQPAVFTSPGA